MPRLSLPRLTGWAVADREYQYAMQKVGMDGVITMERMAEGKMKQKSVALALSAIRRAFEPYDHDQSGDVTPEVFRKALEVRKGRLTLIASSASSGVSHSYSSPNGRNSSEA